MDKLNLVRYRSFDRQIHNRVVMFMHSLFTSSCSFDPLQTTAIVMTPAGMIFTSLNVNKGKKGYENDNALTVARRIVKEKGIMGLFYGGGPMCIRQASNWASRAGFTEICRTNLRMSQYGVWGEIGSGVIGGGKLC